MDKIESFRIDHTKLLPGLYVSRRDKKMLSVVTTFDLRFTAPGREPVMDMPALHTIEHLLATYVRNSVYTDSIIYAGPMGCRTGFYLVVRDAVTKSELLGLLREAFRFIADFTGEIPGSKREECGNYLEHDLDAAKEEARKYLPVLEAVQETDMHYQA